MQESMQNLKKKRGRPKKEVMKSSEVGIFIFPLTVSFESTLSPDEKPTLFFFRKMIIIIFFQN